VTCGKWNRECDDGYHVWSGGRSLPEGVNVPADAASGPPYARLTLGRVAAWWAASLIALAIYSSSRGKADDVGAPIHGAGLEWASVAVHSSWFFVPPLANTVYLLWGAHSASSADWGQLTPG